MTKKEEVNTTKTTKKNSAQPKQILYEAVQENKTRNYIIVGALTRAGLYQQYKYEESVYGVENLEASITQDELNKIIKEFTGE